MKSQTQLATLDNGLTLIGETNSAHRSCGLGFFVRTGARDETSAESGISHFLEHMMFKGTKKRNAFEVSFALGNIGAQANAFTSDENTVYYSSILPEYFPALQEILTDMLRPSLLDEEFDTEKKVILEEIALYQDRPQFYLYENATSAFFKGHPLANSVLGTTASVSAITCEQMRGYFGRRYTSGNTVLVATGNYDWDQFLKRASELTADWSGKAAPREKTAFKIGGKGAEFRRKNLSQPHMLFLSPSCGAQDDERYALAILSVIIGDSSGSKFFWRLVDSGLAEQAGADHDEKDGAGVFTAYASTEPDKIDMVSTIANEILNEPLDFTEADLERAKAKTISRIVLSGELPMGRLMSLGMEWNYRNQLHTLKNEIERYKEVRKSDIISAVSKYPFVFSEYRLVAE